MKRDISPWVMGVVGVVAFGALYGAVSGDDGDDGAMPRVACEDFVSDRLVSPSSADFARPDVSSLGSGEYRVTGTVDADNRMGAAIRIDYDCTVRDDGGDTWTLVDMQHTER